MSPEKIQLSAGELLDDLQWRGLISSSTDREKLQHTLEKPTTFYLGTDPTGASLHAGHLVQYLTVRRLQNAGHTPIVLVGGATGQIGDPREVGERVLLDNPTVTQWNEKLKEQIKTVLDFDNGKAIMVDNLDWTSTMSAIELLRDVGKHFSINVMINRDIVKRRLDNEGISYTEFSYMLLQANDYLQLFKNYDCRLQIGGSDQWGNIISGVDLIRRVTGEHVHALATPLVTDSEGRKIGKSTGGAGVWLDPELTSPYNWYQYFVNISDADAPHYLKWFSFKSREEIETLVEEHSAQPFKRRAQIALAEELTDFIHGQHLRESVQQATKALFGSAALADLDESTLHSALEQASVASIDRSQRHTIVDLLVLSHLVESKSAARRTVKEGGAYVNNVQILDEDWTPRDNDWLHGSWMVLRRGKKKFAGIRGE